MTEKEKELLKRLAEAYAFLEDLRQTAILLGNSAYVQRTAGLDKRIEELRQTYAPLFQRYFNKAKRSATAAQVKRLETDGKREAIQRRKETPPQKGSSEEKVHRPKRRRTRRDQQASKKRGPE